MGSYNHSLGFAYMTPYFEAEQAAGRHTMNSFSLSIGWDGKRWFCLVSFQLIICFSCCCLLGTASYNSKYHVRVGLASIQYLSNLGQWLKGCCLLQPKLTNSLFFITACIILQLLEWLNQPLTASGHSTSSPVLGKFLTAWDCSVTAWTHSVPT